MQTNVTIDPIPLEPKPAPTVRRARLHDEQPTTGRKPEWLRVKLNQNEEYWKLKSLMRGAGAAHRLRGGLLPQPGRVLGPRHGDLPAHGRYLHAVVQVLQRARPASRCRSMRTSRAAWPSRCAQMALRHVVLTSVDRDDQPDGGAHIFADTIREIRQLQPGCTIEVLIPDFKGDPGGAAGW